MQESVLGPLEPAARLGLAGTANEDQFDRKGTKEYAAGDVVHTIVVVSEGGLQPRRVLWLQLHR